MTRVTIPDKHTKAPSALGDVQTAVDLALQWYSIGQIAAKIAHLRQCARRYKAKSGMDYSTFVQRTAHDEAFVQEIEAGVSPLWELDVADWGLCVKGITDWTHPLQNTGDGPNSIPPYLGYAYLGFQTVKLLTESKLSSFVAR